MRFVYSSLTSKYVFRSILFVTIIPIEKYAYIISYFFLCVSLFSKKICLYIFEIDVNCIVDNIIICFVYNFSMYGTVKNNIIKIRIINFKFYYQK